MFFLTLVILLETNHVGDLYLNCYTIQTTWFIIMSKAEIQIQMVKCLNHKYPDSNLL